ncbi:MAG: folate-binding protein [Burkholderiaceae bacterium]
MTIPLLLDGTVPLAHLGLMRARGADAAKFLQGQLTNDVASLGPGQARLAGFCSAKGRLQASFIVWQAAPDELLLLVSASVLPATLKRLSMFVLRAQCKLTDASAELSLIGAVGATAHRGVGDAAVWQTRTEASRTVLRLPDVQGLVRCLFIGAPDEASPAPAIALEAWRWLEVQSGLPTIEAATVEQFVPQMLNFELIGGVDFHKGCYPGQEIVARSQYRGTVKRRMFLLDCDAPMQAGQEVFHAGDPQQPAGMVVNAAAHPAGAGWSALVELKLAALDGGGLHLGASDGALLRLAELPYPVPTDAPAL